MILTLACLVLPSIVVFSATWAFLSPWETVAYYDRVLTTNALVQKVHYPHGDTYYYEYNKLTIQFIDETTNRETTVTGYFYHKGSDIDVGKPIPIYYDPLNSSDAHFDDGSRYDWSDSFSMPSMFAQMAFVGTLIFFSCVWINRRIRESRYSRYFGDY